MTRRLTLLFLGLLVASSACTSSEPRAERTQVPREPEPSATADDGLVIPDVIHVDLREAFGTLEQAGFEVRFGPKVHKSQRRYAKGLAGIDPALWVAETSPNPGDPIDRGGAVVITALECPDRAEACD